MSGAMNHTPAAVIQQLLVDLTLATLPASSGSWPVYLNRHPDDPARSIAVYDTEGTTSGRSMVTGEVFEHFGLQVRVQSEPLEPSYAADKARAIAVAFAEQVLREVVAVGGSSYLVQSISRKGSVISLGVDPSNRHRIFTVNFIVSLRML